MSDEARGGLLKFWNWITRGLWFWLLFSPILLFVAMVLGFFLLMRDR
jgi:hypothetical protein